MGKQLKIFWDELLTHCKEHNDFNFVYKLEIWGLLWIPWFIYIGKQSLKFSINDVDEEDLRKLIDIKRIEFIEEIELSDTIEISARACRVIEHS